jgi:TonB family protein
MRLLLSLLLVIVPSAIAQCTGKPNTPQPLHKTDIRYPDNARQFGLRGNITLQLTVSAEGQPAKIEVVKPFGYGMDEAAVSGVSKWAFSSCCTKYVVPLEMSFDFAGSGFRRFVLGPMTFEETVNTKPPLLRTIAEPDLSGSRSPASDGEIEFSVTSEGDPANFRVIRKIEPVAEKAILQSFAKWKLEPARRGDTPVESRGRFQFYINP